MKLLLCRHGNTFEPGQTARLVGKSQDLPLTQRGLEQAAEVAKLLGELKLKPALILSSNLKRARSFAEKIITILGMPLELKIDSRLDELDYGRWSDLSVDQIKEKFSAEEWEAWDKHSKWPSGAGFAESPERIYSQVLSLLNELNTSLAADDLVLAISSNGRLRYFLQAIPGEFERRSKDSSFKIATGQLSLLRSDAALWSLQCWNEAPHSKLLREKLT